MRYRGLNEFLLEGQATLAKSPMAMIFIEDLVEVESTLRHHLRIGFRAVLAFAPPELVLPADLEAQIHRIDYSAVAEGAVETAVNAVAARAAGAWIYYGYNAEYLFHPFSETRSIAEILAFTAEERRDSVACYVIDLYAGDLARAPSGVSLSDAHLDSSGYYALARRDPADDSRSFDRQLEFYGGLRWRFEEHISYERRRIDRAALFRAKPGLKLDAEFRFNDEEYNTIACPWHNNITAAVLSFRAAKALRANASSKYSVETFLWHNSVKFDWSSRQLLELGMIEPGQWF